MQWKVGSAVLYKVLQLLYALTENNSDSRTHMLMICIAKKSVRWN